MTSFLCEPGSPIDVALEQRAAGNIDGAIETLLAAASDSLANAEVAVTLGKMLAERGEEDRAEHWLRHAFKLAPDDVIVRLGLGAFLGQTGRIADAMSLLAGVRADARGMLVDRLADPDELEALTGFIASTELNLAQAALESGDSVMARELAGPWLSDSDWWGAAHAVYAQVLERDGLDPEELAQECLATGQVSPYMVCYLLERLLDVADPLSDPIAVSSWETCDFLTLDAIVGRADECFDFDWRQAEPELVGVMAHARQTFLQAVMRGRIAPADYPHLAPLLSAATEDASVDDLQASSTEAPTPRTLAELAPEVSGDESSEEDDVDEDLVRYEESLKEWDQDDPLQWTIRERLVGLATAETSLTPEVVARMAAREPLMATPVGGGERTILTSTPQDRFVGDFTRLGYEYGWVTPHFPWPDWSSTPDARRWFDDPPRITREASIDDLIRLMTRLIRGERFCENSLQAAIEDGFVHHLVVRAAILLEELDRGADLPASLFANARKPPTR